MCSRSELEIEFPPSGPRSPFHSSYTNTCREFPQGIKSGHRLDAMSANCGNLKMSFQRCATPLRSNPSSSLPCLRNQGLINLHVPGSPSGLNTGNRTGHNRLPKLVQTIAPSIPFPGRQFPLSILVGRKLETGPLMSNQSFWKRPPASASVASHFTVGNFSYRPFSVYSVSVLQNSVFRGSRLLPRRTRHRRHEINLKP